MRVPLMLAASCAILISAGAWAGDGGKADEVKLTMDQVPAEVAATLNKEAEGQAIDEVERETKNGKTVYEAEVVIEGRRYEIKVDASGKLLSKKAGKKEEKKEDEKS